MTNNILVLLKIVYKTNTPKTPKPTTDIPITAPLEKAIESPLLRDFFVPSAVLEFDIVAVLIPILPVMAEKRAPTINETDKPHSI